MPSGVYARTAEHNRKNGDVHRGKKLGHPSDEHRRKLSEAMKGRIAWNKGLTKDMDDRVLNQSKALEGKPHSEEHRMNNSIAQKQKFANGYVHPFTGQSHTKESIQKNRDAHIGNIPWNKDKQGLQIGWAKGLSKETDERVKKVSDKLKGKPKNEETKQKFSASAIRRIERNSLNGIPMPISVGNNETKILDRLENALCIQIKRQHQVLKYFIDGYNKERNIAFEIDESYHLNSDGSIRECDIKRQKEIEKELGCVFIRLKEKDNVGI